MTEKTICKQDLLQINENLYEIPKNFRSDMRVPARIYMHETMIEDIIHDRSLLQLINVASLPGIQQYAFAMPDIHQGYGFPIGGVAGMAIKHGGVISPGGIGYDINCGVRLLAASINAQEIKPHLAKLATQLYHAVPSGVGRGGKLKLTMQEIDLVLHEGAQHMLKLGYGIADDVTFCEEFGRMSGAQPELVSKEAKERGSDQLGTLGSGNHFLEVQEVEEIFDQSVATLFGLFPGQVTIMIHCGSRGLGHQTCTDYVRSMMNNLEILDYQLPDRELICTSFVSPQGQDYFAAMQAAANFAWANRHTIGHWVRETFQQVLGDDTIITTIYDISHNIGKVEKHIIDGKELELIMHRKGATRAFGPNRPEVVSNYRSAGQPVLIPGTMGTASYVLVGTTESMQQAFGSCCHGAGRRMSRIKAKHAIRGATLRQELEKKGIIIRCDSNAGLAEEAPIAYKNVDEVVEVVDRAHLAHKVARLKPLAVIKGG